MKFFFTLATFLFLTSINAEARVAPIQCGSTPFKRGSAQASLRNNWVFQGGYEQAATLKASLNACRSKYGRQCWGHCLPLQPAKNTKAPTRSQGSRGWDRARSEREAMRALDLAKQREREEALERVLRKERECRLFGSC